MKTPDNPQNCDVIPGIVTKTFNIPTFIDAIPLIKPHVYVQYEYNGVLRTVLLCEWDARYLIDAYMDYRTFSLTGIMDLKNKPVIVYINRDSRQCIKVTAPPEVLEAKQINTINK